MNTIHSAGRLVAALRESMANVIVVPSIDNFAKSDYFVASKL
jgi:hypothetical protein